MYAAGPVKPPSEKTLIGPILRNSLPSPTRSLTAAMPALSNHWNCSAARGKGLSGFAYKVSHMAYSAGGLLASRMLVMPSANSLMRLASRLAANSSGSAGGTSRVTMDCRSRITPLRLPSGLRSITPPSGSGVSAVTPASSSARLLATALCPPARVRMTGLPGAAASRSSRNGRRASVNWSSDQP